MRALARPEAAADELADHPRLVEAEPLGQIHVADARFFSRGGPRGEGPPADADELAGVPAPTGRCDRRRGDLVQDLVEGRDTTRRQLAALAKGKAPKRVRLPALGGAGGPSVKSAGGSNGANEGLDVFTSSVDQQKTP